MKSLNKIFNNWNLIRFYSCSLVVVDATPLSKNQNQLRSLHIVIKNCLFLYANNKRIPKNSLVQVTTLPNQSTIEIKAIGFFQSKKVHIPVGNQKITTSTRKFTKNQSLFIKHHKTIQYTFPHYNLLKPNLQSRELISKNIEISFNKNSISTKPIYYHIKSNSTTLETLTNQ